MKNTIAIEQAVAEAWNELQDVPSYAERYQDQRDGEPYLITLELCSGCGHWHEPSEPCPTMED